MELVAINLVALACATTTKVLAFTVGRWASPTHSVLILTRLVQLNRVRPAGGVNAAPIAPPLKST